MTRRHKLVEARRAAGLTQQQVAEALGISRPAYTRYERGDRTPTVDMAIRIAAVLGRPVEELFDGICPSEARDLDRETA